MRASITGLKWRMRPCVRARECGVRAWCEEAGGWVGAEECEFCDTRMVNPNLLLGSQICIAEQRTAWEALRTPGGSLCCTPPAQAAM